MFKWKFLELYANGDQLIAVRYLLSGTDEKNIVETEGNHIFSDGIVNIPFEQIKETNLIDWLNSDITKDGVNAIKLNLQNQLKVLESEQKVSFPWLADTFTPGS